MDLYTLGSITSVAALGVAWYKGYLTSISSWVETKWKQGQMLYKLINSMNLEPSTPILSSITISDEGNSAVIVYNYYNEPRKLRVPFKREYVNSMNTLKAELIYNDGIKEVITQQSGIPYFMKATDLGAKLIRITNELTNESKDYVEAPMYAEELYFTE